MNTVNTTSTELAQRARQQAAEATYDAYWSKTWYVQIDFKNRAVLEWYRPAGVQV